MFRTKLLATIAIIVITSVASFNVAYGDTDGLLGHASVQDDQGTNDSVTVTVDGVEVPGDGVTYSAHLVSADGASALDLGIVTVTQAIVHGVIQSTGSINHTFDSNSEGYDGSNLLSQYNRVRIVESSDGNILYGGGITVSSSSEINSVITKASSLNEILDAAIANAAAAKAASDVSAAAGDLTAIIDAIPSIQALAAEIAGHAGLAEAANSSSFPKVTSGSSSVVTAANNISAWAESVKDNATQASAQDTKELADLWIDLAAATLGVARNGDVNIGHGSSDIYATGQDMASIEINAGDASYTAAAGESAVEEPTSEESIFGLGLPSVGEPILGEFMKYGMLLGLVLMLGSAIGIARIRG